MKKIIDLGMHPYADTFIGESQQNLSEPVYPLKCFLDSESGMVMLDCPTSADDRYNHYDYSYTSSNSNFAKAHWQKYAQVVPERAGLNKGAKIVEVGSNDAFLCNEFKNNGFWVMGVDASKHMSELATEKGNIFTYCCVFGEQTSKMVEEHSGKVDMVVANNVFNHANDPIDFAKGVVNLLKEDGVFVYELPYWKSTVETKKFDQIYHEHVTYFTVKSSYNLLARVGLEIIDFEEVDYHGGSLRVYAKKVESQVKMISKVNDAIKAEEALGLFNPKTYQVWMKEITRQRDKFLKKVYAIRADGLPIVGVGAAAKGNTFLNFYNLDSTVIDYVTDASSHKQGKYTPLTRIPIVSDEIFAKYDKVYALILSWNISDLIKKKLLEINPNIKFLTIGEDSED